MGERRSLPLREAVRAFQGRTSSPDGISLRSTGRAGAAIHSAAPTAPHLQDAHPGLPDLRVEPTDHLLKWQLDVHHNHLARVLFPEKTTGLIVDVKLIAELSPVNPFDFVLEPDVAEWPLNSMPSQDACKADLAPYRSTANAGPRPLQAFLNTVSRERRAGRSSFLSRSGSSRARKSVVSDARRAVESSPLEETLGKKKWLLP